MFINLNFVQTDFIIKIHQFIFITLHIIPKKETDL